MKRFLSGFFLFIGFLAGQLLPWRVQSDVTYTGPMDDAALQVRIDYDVDSNPIYVGEARPGSASNAARWRIKKLTYSGTNMTVLQFADGNPNFDNVWDNRASLSYS
jgi:hypothetical protein